METKDYFDSHWAIKCCCSHGAAENDVGNVLFIAVDDSRRTFGCCGDPRAVTPNIDTFATKSFLFENTYCQQSVSGPSRASPTDTGLRPDVKSKLPI
ncbi:MAG: sulfatase-like hydrolase/transferase [Parabacteroides merdae]